MGFCRDCFNPTTRQSDYRCLACGSPRIATHPELDRLTIAHVDCDAFYATIEKRDDPTLRDRPVIIGGGKRGVVATACYLARIYGVKSAMPMFKALKACPDAIVIKPDMEKYVRVGREVRKLMLDMTPLVEPVSIDEAFLDLAGTERLHGSCSAITLARFAKRVENEIGITISVGLAANKFLAKIASDLEKPRGFSIIGAVEARDFLAPRPVTLIWGVGKSFATTLQRDGIHTIGQLQTMDEHDLMRRYGIMGQRLARLSRGEDTRRVSTDREAKSVSAETTFDHAIADLWQLEPILRRLSEKVSRRLKKADLGGYSVALKMKTHDFKTITRNRRLTDPTQLADRIYKAGIGLIKSECDGRRFRLIGIGISDLVPAERCDLPDLIDQTATRRAKAERAMDALREKFGGDAIKLGLMLRGRSDRPT
jgi:DNA polymerase-4